MSEFDYEARAVKLGAALRVISIIKIMAGVLLLGMVVVLGRGEVLDAVSGDVEMSGFGVLAAAFLLLSSLVLSGMLAAFRIPWGWLSTFAAATFFFIMAMLTEPKVLLITKSAFFGMLGLSAICWVAGVLYYLYDLYT